MIRKIIEIDESKCNGCELCVKACHENAIGLVDGKAKLLRDDYCDGLGDCLPACPTGAIKFTLREADMYNEIAVMENIKKIKNNENSVDNANDENIQKLPCGCPGTNSKFISREDENNNISENNSITLKSQLNQWPVQIKLVPVNAPYFNNANLLIAADCSAYAYANFHKDFMKGKITLIGCPKLDEGNYTEKLTQIIKNNNIKSVNIIRLEVPCCGGIEQASINALKNSGKFIPWQVFTITTNGEILD